MRNYSDFTEALEDFRTCGGAMNYQDSPPLWQVGEVDEIGESNSIYDDLMKISYMARHKDKSKSLAAYITTHNALESGGMTHEEVEAELFDYEL